MLTNADITIYNRLEDKKNRLDVWQKTVISGVHVYVDNKVDLGETGINSADVYKIRIPAEVKVAGAYLSPEEYKKADNPENHWTIQNDDWIVVGVCDVDIEKPSDLKDFRERSCKVISWSDNRFGGLLHWRIGGV